MNNPYQAPKSNLETVLPEQGTCPRFVFQVGEDEIVCEASLATGRERIYLNGELLFSKLNWRRKGVHNVHLNGEDYQVIVKSDSLVKPIRSCRLEKDGVVLQQYRSVSKPKQMYIVVALLLIFVEALFAELLADLLGVPSWGAGVSMLIFCIVLFAGMYMAHSKGSFQVFEG